MRVRHTGLIYVDDILSLLNRTSAPFWVSVIVILLLHLRHELAQVRTWPTRGLDRLADGLRMLHRPFGPCQTSPSSRLSEANPRLARLLRPGFGAPHRQTLVAFFAIPLLPSISGPAVC